MKQQTRRPRGSLETGGGPDGGQFVPKHLNEKAKERRTFNDSTAMEPSDQWWLRYLSPEVLERVTAKGQQKGKNT